MRRYRCFIARTLQIAESGLREFVQLRAPDAERAARLALAVTGALAGGEVVRLEEPTK